MPCTAAVQITLGRMWFLMMAVNVYAGVRMGYVMLVHIYIHYVNFFCPVLAIPVYAVPPSTHHPHRRRC